jgi:hypothetical protein
MYSDLEIPWKSLCKFLETWFLQSGAWKRLCEYIVVDGAGDIGVASKSTLHPINSDSIRLHSQGGYASSTSHHFHSDGTML